MKKIKFDEIKKKLKFDKIVDFLKSEKLKEHEMHIKIAAVIAAVLLIVVILLISLGKDDSLFPEREWEGSLPDNVNTTNQEEVTTPEETTEEGTTTDPTLGPWVPIG